MTLKLNSTGSTLFGVLLFLLGMLSGHFLSNDYSQESESKTDIANLSEGIIYFDNELIEMFNQRYSNEEEEFMYCLDGVQNKGENTIYFNEINPTKIINRSKNSVRFNTCPKLGMIHSHPSGSCFLSNLDLKVFEVEVECIICGYNQISCFNKNNQKIKVVI